RAAGCLGGYPEHQKAFEDYFFPWFLASVFGIGQVMALENTCKKKRSSAHHGK
ncbi:MAG: hypothetical protein ACI936_001808, partial [Paraglaciecola sp.]